MKPFPLNYVIMTTTKGHFDRHDIYSKTVGDLATQIPLLNFSGLFASIKVSPDSSMHEKDMVEFFSRQGFSVYPRYAEWKHHHISHQVGYLNDLTAMFLLPEVNENEFSLVTEDDFLIRSHDDNLCYWFSQAMRILKENPEIVQVRIPRFTNEFDRINGLKAKHGLDVEAVRGKDDSWFYAGDWSNNVYFCRTRDLRNALILMSKNPHAFQPHSEHGLSPAMKYFSLSRNPFAIFDPKFIRCYHIGSPEGEEDKLDKELNSG